MDSSCENGHAREIWRGKGRAKGNRQAPHPENNADPELKSSTPPINFQQAIFKCSKNTQARRETFLIAVENLLFAALARFYESYIRCYSSHRVC